MAGADPPSFFCKCFSYWSYFGKRYHDNHLRAQSEASYTHNITLLRNLTQNVCIGIATLLMTPLATGFLGSCDGNVALGQNFKDPHLPPTKGLAFPLRTVPTPGSPRALPVFIWCIQCFDYDLCDSPITSRTGCMVPIRLIWT